MPENKTDSSRQKTLLEDTKTHHFPKHNTKRENTAVLPGVRELSYLYDNFAQCTMYDQ